MITIYDETKRGWEVKPIGNKSLYSFAKTVKIGKGDKAKTRRMSLLANGDFEPLLTETEKLKKDGGVYSSIDMTVSHYFCHKDFNTILTTKAKKSENIFCLTFDVRNRVLIGIEGIGDVYECDILEYLLFGGELTVLLRLHHSNNTDIELFFMDKKTKKISSTIIQSNGNGYDEIDNPEKNYPHLFKSTDVDKIKPLNIERKRPKNLPTYNILCVDGYVDDVYKSFNRQERCQVTSIVDNEVDMVLKGMRDDKIQAVTVFVPVGGDGEWDVKSKELYTEAQHRFKVVLLYEFYTETRKGKLIHSKL